MNLSVNQKTSPEISIIIPVYNTEKYLVRCLESIKHQTFRSIEIICIDDGSTDRSLEILRNYADSDKRFIVFHQNNSGPASARNVGLEKAQGNYIMFCDSDDRYEKKMCETMHNILNSNLVDIGICNSNVIVENPKKNRNKKNIKNFILKHKKGRINLMITIEN